MLSFDAVSNATPGAGELSWAHTPVGTPRGALVWVIQSVGAVGEVTGATYGGEAMVAVDGSPVLHTEPEAGVVDCFFLGSGIPTGEQTVVVSVDGGGSMKTAGCVTITASTDTIIADADVTINDVLADPSVTLLFENTAGLAALGFLSGQDAVTGVTPFTGWTSQYEYDFTSQVCGIYTFDMVGLNDVDAGWTQTIDDATMIAVLVREAVAPGPVLSGQTVVATAGAAVQLGTLAVNAAVLVKALDTNGGAVIAIGNDGDGDVTVDNGLRLLVGEEVVFDYVSTLAKLWIDSSVNAKGVSWMVLEV